MALGQELNCSVFVNADRVESTEREVFKEMETSFAQFLNNRKWTNDTYTQDERINCNIVINIQDMPSVGIFDATVQIVSARPVYGTSYESIVFNFADRDWILNTMSHSPCNLMIMFLRTISPLCWHFMRTQSSV